MGELKVLVLGDGLLGSEIIKQTEWDCISRKEHGFDITNTETYNLITTVEFGSIVHCKYDVIINCIANTDTYSVDKDSHWDVNYKGLLHLIKFCNKWKVKLIHISTDYVYSGSESEATENSIPVHCNNWYGYTKLLGDGLVQLMSEDYLLCRCTHKPKPFPYDSAWIDQLGNFDYVETISNLIISMINNKLTGLYNVGTETKTMYELASQTRKVKKIYSPNQVPKNLSMSLGKLNSNLKTPFFSIAIPAYEANGRGVEFLEHSFNLFQNQTFTDFEVVVSDHSLNEDIKDLCDSWSDKLDIKYLKNSYRRGGSSPNINNAIKNSNGKWIKLLWQDDFLFNYESLEKLRTHIINNNTHSWFVTACEHSPDGHTMTRPHHPYWTEDIHLGNNRISSPSVVTIKNEEVLYFDEDLIWLMDVEYYKRMHNIYGEPSYFQTINVVNRVRNDGLTQTLSQEIKNKEVTLMRNKYKN